MSTVCKMIDRLKFSALQEQMLVLTPSEAGAIYQHIEMLINRAADKEQKFIAMCDHTYDLVKINRDLKKQLGQL